MLVSFLKISLAVIVCIALSQLSSIYLLRLLQPDLVTADMVAVMVGSKDRIASGCKVAASQDSGNLMLTNNTSDKLQKYAAEFNVTESVSLLPGGKSRSSFEDIHTIVQTAHNRHFSSVILVTSDYHMPRALFLINAYNFIYKNQLHIQYKVTSQQTKYKIRLKRLYMEVVKFWGSIAEMIGYIFSKQLPLNSEKVLIIRNTFKKIIF